MGLTKFSAIVEIILLHVGISEKKKMSMCGLDSMLTLFCTFLLCLRYHGYLVGRLDI